MQFLKKNYIAAVAVGGCLAAATLIGSLASAADAPKPGMPSADQMRAALQAYIDASHTGSFEALRAVYSEDAKIEDPIGGGVKQGKDVDAFLKRVAGSKMTFELASPIALSGTNEAAMFFKAHLPNGGILNVIEAFTVNDKGKLTSMRAWVAR